MPEERYRLRDGTALQRLMRSPEPGRTAQTPQSLAEVCGLSASKIHKLLQEARPTVSRSQAELIASAVSVSVDTLFSPTSSASADADKEAGMSPKDPKVRELRARLGAHASWARTADRQARTAPARAARAAKYEQRAREMHPDATDEQIARVAEHLMKAEMTAMSLKAAQARKQKAAARVA